MNQQFSRLDSRVQVPITWEVMYGQAVSEIDLVQAIKELPVAQLLPGLITLLQYGDASEPPGYKTLDRHLFELFGTEKAYRIAARLSLGSQWIFFSRWQLLLAGVGERLEELCDGLLSSGIVRNSLLRVCSEACCLAY